MKAAIRPIGNKIRPVLNKIGLSPIKLCFINKFRPKAENFGLPKTKWRAFKKVFLSVKTCLRPIDRSLKIWSRFKEIPTPNFKNVLSQNGM